MLSNKGIQLSLQVKGSSDALSLGRALLRVVHVTTALEDSGTRHPATEPRSAWKPYLQLPKPSFLWVTYNLWYRALYSKNPQN